jgi:hypothetical protein
MMMMPPATMMIPRSIAMMPLTITMMMPPTTSMMMPSTMMVTSVRGMMMMSPTTMAMMTGTMIMMMTPTITMMMKRTIMSRKVRGGRPSDRRKRRGVGEVRLRQVMMKRCVIAHAVRQPKMKAPCQQPDHLPTIGARRSASPRRVRLKARVSMNHTRRRASGSAVAPSEEEGPVQLVGVAVSRAVYGRRMLQWFARVRHPLRWIRRTPLRIRPIALMYPP